MAKKGRELAAATISQATTWDERLIGWIATEYQLYRAVEDFFLQQQIAAITNTDGFLSLQFLVCWRCHLGAYGMALRVRRVESFIELQVPEDVEHLMDHLGLPRCDPGRQRAVSETFLDHGNIAVYNFHAYRISAHGVPAASSASSSASAGG